MKLLFYVLCLLNAGYFLWQFHEGRLNLITPQPVSYSSILLVSEYARAQRGAAISEVLDKQVQRWKQTELDRILSRLRDGNQQTKRLPVTVHIKPIKTSEPAKMAAPASKEPPIPRKCYQVGAFKTEVLARQWLGKNALSPQQLLQKDTVPAKDYQVYFPAAKTPEQSRLDKMLLVAKGLRDIWTIPSGEFKGGFSLGVFSDKQRAIVFKNQLAGQGIRAEILARGDAPSQWYATVMLDKNQRQSLERQDMQWSNCSDP